MVVYLLFSKRGQLHVATCKMLILFQCKPAYMKHQNKLLYISGLIPVEHISHILTTVTSILLVSFRYKHAYMKE